MPKLKISLIIPAYNEEKYIWDCLEYVFKNRESYLHEIIVIDNNSTDQTKKIATTYPGVKVVSEKKKWTSSARQRWYLESTGDILAFIDADTHMPAWWAKKIEEKFVHDNKTWVISGPYSFYDLPWYSFFYSWLYYSPILSYIVFSLVGGICTGGNFAIKRDVLDKMKWFNTDILFYGDEADVVRRAKKYTRVQYLLNLKMPTSSRRYAHQGIFKTISLYMINMFKPSSTPVKDFR
ncbi:MAG: Glycosyl transferase family 2 [uncultured bacterium (gcode 4)]|uniref:Glycosyl transferase family 2 n=1 Tax=uncultured bacterium (gcode 4) TaxID=1234023 RepID=K1XJU9_9BACT|nr:MAG: Glycosyl transferase family 2 [uncultured bacterium (gcode 4)]